MTAISAAAPSSPQAVIPTLPESKPAAQSQSSFKKVFKDLPDSGEPDEAQPVTKGKKSSQPDDSSVPVPFVSAPAKLLLPLSLPRPEFQAGNPKSAQDPADVEVLDNPNPNTPAPNGDFAFAAKLVDTKPIDTKLVQTAPQQSPASAITPKSASPPTPPPKISKEPATSQPQSNAAPAPEHPEAASTQEQTPAPAATTPTRDVIVASPPAQTAEPVSTAHAMDRVAPLETASKGPAAPVNEISVRVAGPDQTSASIHMIDRSGELTVAVRSADTQLADALRGNVDQLSARLNTSGWNAEVWRPAVQSASRSEATAQDTARDRQESQPQQFRDQTRRDSQNNRQKRPDWVEEFYARNE